MAEECKCGCCSAKDDRYAALDQVIAKYKDQPGTLIPVLHQAQQIFGYLPKEVQIYIAEGLDVPLAEVYGVVTFYALFTMKPKGRHQIGVCLGTACYVKGSGQILETLKQQLGIGVDDSTDDGRFSLNVLRCIGACGLAPAMMIDGEVYGRLTPDKIAGILAKYE